MKQVLSLLMAFIFLQMQTWALSGGPVYPTGSTNLAGIYSGVMVQRSSKFGEDFASNSGSVENQDAPAGNIGVYSIVIPVGGGVTTGTVVLFVNGTLFQSNQFTGVADPDKGTFDGVFDAAAIPTITDANGNTINPTGEGQMRAKIIESPTVPLPGRSTTGAGSAARMTGTAIIDVSTSLDFNFTPSPLVQAKYSISGYRQITTALP